MDQLFINLEKRNSVSGEDSYLHIISEEGDKIITAANLARGLFNVLTGGEPEAHNQIYRGGKILTDTLHMLTSSQPAVDEISGANLAAGKKYVVKVTALDSKGEALKQLVKVTKNKKSISVMKQPLSKVKATGKARKNLTFALRKLT